MTAVIGVVAGMLQLTIPPYAFRLVRLYGTRRVGWFLVAAFLTLALLHLTAHMQPAPGGWGSDPGLNAIYAIAAVLLLIGMCHMETLCSTRDGVERKVRAECESRVKTDLDQLARSNRELQQQVALQMHSERAAKAAEAQQRFLFMENPQPMWIMELPSARFLAVNRAALALYGYEPQEFIARHGRDLLAAPSDPQFDEDLGHPCSTPQSRGTWQHQRKDGSLMDLEIAAVDFLYGVARARLVVAHDVTGRREREQQKRKAQILAAMSRFSDGVARHYHQLFAVVERNSALVLSKLPDGELAGPVNQISAAAGRGAALNRQFTAISGQYLLNSQPVDVNALLRGMSHKLGRLLGEGILVQNTYGVYQAPVLADAALLEHVIVSLALNARDAMPKGGTLVISTAIHRQKDESGRESAFVRLSLRDTGCGLSEEARERLFEPFFTTKDPERAMGLGLAAAHGIIRQHGGWMEFQSGEGTGTELMLFLPCAPVTTTIEPTRECSVGGVKRTVMLVDSDDRTRALARCTLNWNGFRVIEADSSALALLLWNDQGQDVDLLLTSLTFSEGPTGMDLARHLQEQNPRLKTVYTADPSVAGSAIPLDTVTFLRKPYTPERLLREVRKLFEVESKEDQGSVTPEL